MGQTINQVKHFYLTNAVITHACTKASPVAPGVNVVSDAAGIPEGIFVATVQNDDSSKLVRSDYILLKNILSAKVRTATEMQHVLKITKISLDPAINSGNPVAGQDYITNVLLRNYVGLGEEDTYLKFGLAHAFTGMTPAVFYATMALSLAKNIGREATIPFEVFLGITGNATTETAAVQVTKDTKLSALTGAYTCVYIREVEQPWILGVMPAQWLGIFVTGNNISADGDDVQWIVQSTVSPATFNGNTNVVGNGHDIADLEYFCMGARGDDYRMMGFPNVIRTTYAVDPTATYNTIDIHYYSDLSNESVQKSEKTITIALSAAVGPLVTALNTVFTAGLGHNLLESASGGGNPG